MASKQNMNVNPFVSNNARCQHDDFCVNKRNIPRTGHEFADQQQMSRLREDECYLRQRNYDSTKPWKFITYQYHPYSCKVAPTGYPGQYYNDGHVGACSINADSKLKLSESKMTNPNLIHTLDNFRPNWPHIRGYYDPDIESPLVHSEWQPQKKSCLPSTGVSYTDRGYIWQYFDHLCYNPQDVNYVVNEHYFRGGIPTRNDLRQYYLPNKYCSKRQAKNLH